MSKYMDAEVEQQKRTSTNVIDFEPPCFDFILYFRQSTLCIAHKPPA